MTWGLRPHSLGSGSSGMRPGFATHQLCGLGVSLTPGLGPSSVRGHGPCPGCRDAGIPAAAAGSALSLSPPALLTDTFLLPVGPQAP